MLESELFGHTRGSFTGAVSPTAKGIFEQADGGTVLLDEIGETSLALQVRLLRTIEEGEVRPVGAQPPGPGRCPCHLGHEPPISSRRSRTQRFRQDLFYRLSVIVITVPPLRERRPTFHC